MKTIDKILCWFETYFSAMLLCIMTIAIFAQVICRRIGAPLSWSEESARYMFVWLTYIALSQAVRKRKQISVDILPLILGDTGKKVIRVISNILCIVFFAVIFYCGFDVMNKFILMPQKSPAMHINMMIPYAAPFVGAALSMLRYVMDTIWEIWPSLRPEGSDLV